MKQYQITRIGCFIFLTLCLVTALFFMKILWAVLQSPAFWIALALMYLYRQFRRKSFNQPSKEKSPITTRQHDLKRYEMYETLDEDE